MLDIHVLVNISDGHRLDVSSLEKIPVSIDLPEAVEPLSYLDWLLRLSKNFLATLQRSVCPILSFRSSDCHRHRSCIPGAAGITGPVYPFLWLTDVQGFGFTNTTLELWLSLHSDSTARYSPTLIPSSCIMGAEL